MIVNEVEVAAHPWPQRKALGWRRIAH
jgi:hypothetical protein